MNSMNTFSSNAKQLFTEKKTKMTIYIIGVLWIAVIMQIAVNGLLQHDNTILEAFVSTNSDISSSELEMAADYGKGYLSEADKRELIIHVAGEIGLVVDQDLTINRDEDDSEIFIEKVNKYAETLIKIVSVKVKNSVGIPEIHHYLLVRLKIYKNMDSIINYRMLLEKVFKELETSDLQTSMQLTGNYKGKLSVDEMNQISDRMINNLEGKVAYANRKEELYTIYAYSGLLDEYVTSLDTKINIHIAINYDEDTHSTNVYLGTPVINDGY